jgi:hypothetical protein
MNENHNIRTAQSARNPLDSPIHNESMDLFAEELPEHSEHFTVSSFSSFTTAATTCAWSTFATLATRVSP